ncbi:MAG: hypothetical protein KatS3mg109_0577 [Pirellulaceae bacterium]|nr:MAG: hypothetical protein KatS3mg109_0577 [Pirellulaceae bacterium]
MPRRIHIQPIPNIEVTIVPPCMEGILYPCYDSEGDYVTLDSKVQQQWPIGVNIDALVILDFNADRVLASVEILMPFELWEQRDFPVPQGESVQGVLRLARPCIIPSSFSMTPPRFFVYASRDENGLLMFGEYGSRILLVHLSEYCRAIISDNNLVGFFFDLPKRAKRIRFTRQQQ